MDRNETFHKFEATNQTSDKIILLFTIREYSGKTCDYLLRYSPFMAHIFEGRINGHKIRAIPRKAY